MTEWAGVGASWEARGGGGCHTHLLPLKSSGFPSLLSCQSVHANLLKVALQMSAEDYSCKQFYQPTDRWKKWWPCSLLPDSYKAELIWGLGVVTITKINPPDESDLEEYHWEAFKRLQMCCRNIRIMELHDILSDEADKNLNPKWKLPYAEIADAQRKQRIF